MFEIQPEDSAYLEKSQTLGEVVLILGAGASFTSTNRSGAPVKQSDALAALIAERAGLQHAGESLPVVLGAVRGILGDELLKRIYETEYRGVNPSRELSEIFAYSWKRLYTWCIDDAIENVVSSRIQRIQQFNGMSDPVQDLEDPVYLQYIKLHGSISRPDQGFIMSDAQYAAALSSESHAWYRKAAQDYLSYTPVFVGSRLSEPILYAELARASRDASLTASKAFLITPDDLSQIEKANFRARGIVHVRATLADFVGWLKGRFPGGLSPREVLAHSNNFSRSADLPNISDADIAIAHSLFPREMEQLKSRVAGISRADVERDAQRFLRGTPPTWEMAASDVPVWLSPTTGLYEAMSLAIRQRSRMFVVSGQAGSGKTTAVMQALIRYGVENPLVKIYELRGEVRSVRAALSLLLRLHPDPVVLYVPDLFIFSDTFGADLESIAYGRITVISTTRKGEWRETLQPFLGGIVSPHDYSRFGRVDYQPLIDVLLRYMPAPAFKKLSPTSRLEKIAKSKDQLLIALRETTESQNFTDTITNEFRKLPDEDTRLLLLIVGLGTVARVGVSEGVAREVYAKLSKSRSFDAALAALDGIVTPINGGRLFARHELYVRHLIDNVASLDLLIDCMIYLLSTFTKYPVPVVRHLNRIDSILFRFATNHDFISQQCRRRGRLHDGERLYSHFEIDFQLDGHFWLQYGLYLAECGRQSDALVMLQRSIKAYPNNPYAVHAYGELQLHVAMKRPTFDEVAAELIGNAVKLLLELDAAGENNDQYPMVTLANLHVGALIKHGDNESARRAATQYFDRLQELERRTGVARVTQAKERVFRFVTLGEWSGADKLRRSPAANTSPFKRGNARKI